MELFKLEQINKIPLLLNIIILLFGLGTRILISAGIEINHKIAIYLVDYTWLIILIFIFDFILSFLLKQTRIIKIFTIVLSIVGIIFYNYSYNIFKPW